MLGRRRTRGRPSARLDAASVAGALCLGPACAAGSCSPCIRHAARPSWDQLKGDLQLQTKSKLICKKVRDCKSLTEPERLHVDQQTT
ncbi:hypothetical protein H920_07448 [Fukomys damarensis]|uniref:Uncharacterized protein n=1 Tax=Fukomys damarensis TaxID=885580 RepID=A0A091DG89_FUKDA|nr:hypothetical protein H920_07448 [Fukomys damarensis]